MSERQDETVRGGIGFASILTLLFITLKLCHVIEWSWWWVTVPLWGGVALIVAAFIVLFIIGMMQEAYKHSRFTRAVLFWIVVILMLTVIIFQLY